MQRLRFHTAIKASARKVSNIMLGLDDKKTYEQWTAVFDPSSSYEGGWEKGSKICFTAVDGDGQRGGMVSEIVEHIPNRLVSIRHYGILDGDTEITEGEDVEKWAGSLENYFFEEKDGMTEVTIEVDTDEGHIENFNKQFPEALARLKTLCEQ